jgi:hypothetical protein
MDRLARPVRRGLFRAMPRDASAELSLVVRACTQLYIIDPSSHQRGRPVIRNHRLA